MRPRFFMILAALFAGLVLVTTPPAAEAQTSKECKSTCKSQKKACQAAFKAEFDAEKTACGSDKTCKKNAKTAFKANKKSCVKDTEDTEGFKTCKNCCKGDDLASCGIKVCGDGQTVAPEECDDGTDNSATAPNACRTTCVSARCGDGVQDSGEACDDGANNSDTAPNACRTDCQPASCGDDVKDAGDECDGTDDDACPGECRNDCECTSITCGNDMVDPGTNEECDGTDDAACACGAGSCLPDCTCFTPTRLAFTTGLPAGTCGRINDNVAGTGTDLVPYGQGSAVLTCGTLYIGGGGSSQPPSPTPDGASNIFKVSDCSVSTAYVLAAATSTDTGSNRNCTSPGCLFGPPLPIPNSGSPGASTCIVNSIAASPAAGGLLNATAGSGTQTLPLTVTVRVTGDLEPAAGIQPCPSCTGLTCDSGSNSGGACTTTSSLLTSHDCPLSNTTLAPFNVDLSPLTTGATTLTSGTGVFCPGPPVQRTAGCLGTGAGTCKYIEENGIPAGDLTAGPALASTLASTFCIAKSSSVLINSVADLPGPGAVTLKGSADLQ